MYYVVKNTGGGKNEESKSNIELLNSSIKGNFPGTEIEELDSDKIEESVSNALNVDKAGAISILSGIPSEKSEKFICQGIEKLLNGILPQQDKSYTVVFLAESIPIVEIHNILSGYEELATSITPFAEHQFQKGENATETNGEMESFSHSEGVSHAISKTHSLNVGVGMKAPNSKENDSSGGGAGINLGYGYSHSSTETTSEQKTETKGTNHSVSLGTSENTTYTYKSYLVSDLLDMLNSNIKRIVQSKSNGLWRYAAYVLSDDAETTTAVANYMRSIVQGDESYIEPSFVQTWTHENGNKENPFDEILKYVKRFCHPIFLNMKDETPVYPTMSITSTELANIFAFPRKSVPGLPVIECAEFGRNISTYDCQPDKDGICLGKIFHMNQIEPTSVTLNKNSLSSHMFITGSTGAGKSNTVYKILGEAREKDVHFLVIEPAKGEYKKVFGDDAAVYGTNKDKTDLLRINPFSFPKDIHVLEHLDRLVEIFNVCWPMYAAMPAVLKNALEKSYEDCGWDLTESVNEFGKDLYPNFGDVVRNVKAIIDDSEYDKENKGAYIGYTNTPTGKLLFTLMSAIAQFERDCIADRTMEGLKAARARGRVGGRPRINKEQVKRAVKLYNTGQYALKEIEELTGVKKDTLYRNLKSAQTV